MKLTDRAGFGLDASDLHRTAHPLPKHIGQRPVSPGDMAGQAEQLLDGMPVLPEGGKQVPGV